MKTPKEEKKDEESFLDKLMENEYAQIFVSATPGAILLCVAIVVAAVLNLFVASSYTSLVFVPILCIMPLLSGAIATLLLRRVSKEDGGDIAHCAGTGALSGFIGATGGAIILIVLILLKKQPLGGMFSSTILEVIALALILIMSAVLSALAAGALAFFFNRNAGKKKSDGEE
jgi:hypothetical protein